MKSNEELTCVFNLDTLAARESLRVIVQMLTRLGAEAQSFELDGKGIRLNDALHALETSGRHHFSLEGAGYIFDHVTIRNSCIDTLSIKHEQRLGSLWDSWASCFISLGEFVMAWLVDAEYEYWQNAYDPLQFESAGRSYKRLPMVSNNLPAPLEKMIIDTSKNPGRTTFRSGFVEAVGNVMWLGEPFWRITQAEKNAVLRATWLKVSEPSPGVLRIQATKECFSSDKDDTGSTQQDLRRLLFSRTCC